MQQSYEVDNITTLNFTDIEKEISSNFSKGEDRIGTQLSSFMRLDLTTKLCGQYLKKIYKMSLVML